MVVEAGTVCESVIQEEKIFEWKINDFLQHKDRVVRSPEFCFSDASWRIAIFPLHVCNLTVVYLGLEIYPVSLPKPLTVTMTLGFKTVNGKRDLEDSLTRFINSSGMSAFHRPKVILRFDLFQRKTELLPSGTLTVICTLKYISPNVVKERQFLDASVQTGEITEHKLLDASAQTEEITEIWKLQKQLHEISISGDISDVILKVEDQEFKSHRCILAARSPVFAAMFKNEMRENVTGVVDIEDIDPKTFSDFLNYLYTGTVENLTPENVAKLYTAANKYQMEVLEENCMKYMLVNVSVENFCDVFMLSMQHNEENLKETCFQYFAKHFLDIIQTCKWQSFLCENPITCNELHIKCAKLSNKNTST